MIYLLISIIILLLSIIVYTHFILRKKANEEIKQKLNNELSEYKRKIEEKRNDVQQNFLDFQTQVNNKIEKLKEEEKKETELYNVIYAELKEKRELCEQQIAYEKDNIVKRLQEYELSYQQQIEEHCDYHQLAIQEKERLANEAFEKFKLEKEKEKEEINLQLADLKAKFNATIEAWKAEEQKQLDTQFYIINLSEDDKEDIKNLSSIQYKLSNKDALRKLIYESFIKKPLNDLLFRIIGETTYSGIYKITHIPSNKSYIGKSVDVKKRLTEHVKGALGIASIADQQIHHAMAEYGLDQFTFEILEKIGKDDLNEREKYWIKFYNSQSWGWNGNSGG